MLIDEMLGTIAAKYPSKDAFAICGGDSVTFGDLDARVNAIAASLMSAGVARGDRIGIVSGHDIDALVMFWAVLRVGAIVVWLNDDVKPDDFSRVIRNAAPATVFLQKEKHRRLFAATPPDATRVALLSEIDTFDRQTDTCAQQERRDSDTALIVYTSGSSGRPKGVCLSHRNLMTVVESVQQHMPIGSSDSYFMVVPLHYVHGAMQLLVHSLAGATIYFHESFIFPGKVIEALRATAASGFSGVPFHFNALVSRGGLLKAQLPDLKWMTVTGGKLAASSITEIIDHFPEVDFHIAYGQTECAPRATALAPRKLRDKMDSVGSPIPNVSVHLLDPDGNSVPQGEVGEVVIEGSNVMQGYWRDEAATSEVLDDAGRLHTGDLGRFDEEGDLFLVGRKSAMIKSAGERIVPEEIERILVAHDYVVDAVVVGVADELFGQRVVAHVNPAPAASELDQREIIEALKAHCLESLPLARTPRVFKCWDEFPRKANGKADRVKIALSLEQD